MRKNHYMDHNTMRGATGITIPLLSGAMTGIAAGADVAGVRIVGERSFQVSGIRIRWVTTTAFTAAQALAFRVNKVYSFTAVHDTGSPTAVQAHYRFQGGVQGTSTGDRIALTEISSTIAATAAISGAVYTAEDTDEPEVFAVGAGSTLPGVYEDWSPPDDLPLVLTTNTGLIVNNHILMGAGGAGNLFVGVDGFWVQ